MIDKPCVGSHPTLTTIVVQSGASHRQAKVEQLDKRVANQEFLNRGVFIGLLIALLGGLVNFFGWIPKG